LPDIPQIDDLSLRDHLVAQHAPRPGWREEFSCPPRPEQLAFSLDAILLGVAANLKFVEVRRRQATCG